jgi:hypothetical protein
MFADQGLQLHYIIVVAKLALPKNCHFSAEQGSGATVIFFADQGSATTNFITQVVL